MSLEKIGKILIPAADGANHDPEWDTQQDLIDLDGTMKTVEKLTTFNAYKFYNSKNSARKGKVPWPAVCFEYTFNQYILHHRNIKNSWAYVETLWKTHAPNALEALQARRNDQNKGPDPKLAEMLKEFLR